MPQAKPTQVIVHRIELQQSERKQLEEFLEAKGKVDIANAASKFVGPAMIAGSVIGGVWVGSKVWAAVQAALLGPIEQAQENIDLLQLAPEGSTARQAGDFGDRATDYVWDTLFGLFES